MSWNQPSQWNQPGVGAVVDVSDERVSAFLSRVYGWMFAGLLVTAITAFTVAASPALIETLIVNRIVFWALLIAQLGLVFYLSARVAKVAPATAAGLFILYSALVGVPSSFTLLLYYVSALTPA